jgi:anti-sigma factor ChrR (cupin superfamily)
MLVRMAPGSSYPPHLHASSEECFVVEGDLHVGDDLVMNAGDYQRAHGGSVHPVQYTEGGCVLFIMSSLHDELIP